MEVKLPGDERNSVVLHPYFNLSEFACRCGKHCGGYVVYSPALLLGLILLRHKLMILEEAGYAKSAAVDINCALRCEKHNREIGGIEGSEHLFLDGMAAADVGTRRTGLAPLDVALLVYGQDLTAIRALYSRVENLQNLRFLTEKIEEFKRIGVYGTALDEPGYHGKKNFIHLGIKDKISSRGLCLPSRWGDWPFLENHYKANPMLYKPLGGR